MAQTQQERDRAIVEAARALLYDTATVLHDLQRRCPKLFAARVRMLVTEVEQVARELEDWDALPSRYAHPPTSVPRPRSEDQD